MYGHPITKQGRGADVFLLIGQSNGSGLGLWDNPEPPSEAIVLFGNDYRFQLAQEPTNNARYQKDSVSLDASSLPGVGIASHSAWLRACKQIRSVRGGRYGLIPCCKGSTVIRSNALPATDWQPKADPYDRTTLFGSANYRRRLVADGTLKAIWVFGYETSTETSWGGEDLLSTYTDDFRNFIKLVREKMQANVPVVYAQLGAADNGSLVTPTSATDTGQEWMRVFMGRNRLLAAESLIPNCQMVTTFDGALKAGDGIHLSRAALDSVGNRFALATRQLVYGESLDAKGPRPVAAAYVGDTTVDVEFNKTINAGASNFDSQFRVYRSGHKAVSAAVRRGASDPDNKFVRLTCASLGGSTGIEVTYGQTKRNTALTNHVVDTSGLPSPAFTLTI